MNLDVQDKVYLITGASRGLGYSIAEHLYREGACVCLSSSNADSVSAAAQNISGTADDTRLKADVCDVRDASQIAQWVSTCVSQFGRLDGLLINAGGPPPGGFDNFSDDDWQAAFELTLLSAVRLVRAALPSLRASGGSVLLLTSSSVKEPVDFLLLSNVMRSGVNSLSKSLSRTLGPEGVRFNCIVPGMVETDRIKGLTEAQAALHERSVEAQKAEMEGAIPMGRFGRPEEFGRVGAFLLSPAASYISGANIVVDGAAMRSV